VHTVDKYVTIHWNLSPSSTVHIGYKYCRRRI